jgi:hypothetical protein
MWWRSCFPGLRPGLSHSAPAELQEGAGAPDRAHTDREIDQLVYELYGLTDNEIALVEAAINYQWAPCACFLGGTFSLR